MPNILQYAGWREDNFIYSTGWSDAMAAAGAVVNPQIAIAADAPFKCYYITAAIKQGQVGAEVLVLNWAGTVIIKDSALGKDLMNVEIPVDAIGGNGQLPYILTPPRIFNVNTTIVFTITSNVAATTFVNFCFHGAKLYKM